MAQWKIKELSRLTNVSVRMLHHYDKIGLLKPAVRTSNGYRLYNEQNLATLQQIIALKFFGFSLSQIKTMLHQQMSIKQHLLVQQKIIKEQTDHLKQAHEILEDVIQRYSTSDSLAWNDLITLIERYNMAEEVKKDWQRNYNNLKEEYPKEVVAWEKMIQEINNQQLGNPEGDDGKRAVEAFLNFSKAQTTWEQSTKIQNDEKAKGFSNEEILQRMLVIRDTDTPLKPTKEGNIWFSQALSNYFLTRWNEIHKTINENINNDPNGSIGKKIAQEWRDLISQQTMGGHPETFLGLMLWQEISESQNQIKEEKKPTMQKKYVALYLDPRALTWIDKALKSK